MNSGHTRNPSGYCHASHGLFFGHAEENRKPPATLPILSLLWVWVVLSLGWPTQGAALTIERWETDSGMRVLFAPAPALPMLDLRLTFDAGAARDGDHPGLARLTSSALADGTEGLATDALAERFEQVGARFGTDSVRDMALVTLRTLTEPDWMATAVDTLVQLLAAPAFPEDGLERRRRQQLQGLLSERQDPGSQATRRFYEVMYAGHPYGNPVRGTEASIPTLIRERVTEFFETYYTAGNAVLALTGDLTRDEAEALADRVSRALPQGPRAAALPPAPRIEHAIVERMAFPSEQAHIFIGAPSLQRSDPDNDAMTIMNHILGGGSFTSRLFQEVRTQRGLAYSVYSSVQPMSAEGPFLMSMQTALEQTDAAIEVMMDELRRLHSEGPTAEEWAASIANITGGFPQRVASNGDIVRNLGAMGFYDLPDDYLAGYVGRIESTDAETAHRIFRERIDPDRLITVIVGGSGS
jgi:zinc protease